MSKTFRRDAMILEGLNQLRSRDGDDAYSYDPESIIDEEGSTNPNAHKAGEIAMRAGRVIGKWAWTGGKWIIKKTAKLAAKAALKTAKVAAKAAYHGVKAAAKGVAKGVAAAYKAGGKSTTTVFAGFELDIEDGSKFIVEAGDVISFDSMGLMSVIRRGKTMISNLEIDDEDVETCVREGYIMEASLGLMEVMSGDELIDYLRDEARRGDRFNVYDDYVCDSLFARSGEEIANKDNARYLGLDWSNRDDCPIVKAGTTVVLIQKKVLGSHVEARFELNRGFYFDVDSRDTDLEDIVLEAM